MTGCLSDLSPSMFLPSNLQIILNGFSMSFQSLNDAFVVLNPLKSCVFSEAFVNAISSLNGFCVNHCFKDDLSEPLVLPVMWFFCTDVHLEVGGFCIDKPVWS